MTDAAAHAETIRDTLLYVPDNVAPALVSLDALVALAERAATLEAERDDAVKWRHMHDAAAADWQEELDRREAAEAALAAATETLREIANAEPDDSGPVTYWPSFAGRLQSLAGDFLARTDSGKAEA